MNPSNPFLIPRLRGSGRAAFTLVELLVSMAAASLVFIGILVALITLERSYAASASYVAAATGSNRVLGYLAADFRRAVRVNQGPLSTSAPLLGTSSAFVLGSGSSALSLSLPDYYASNNRTVTSYRASQAPFGSGLQTYTTVTQMIDAATGKLLDPNATANIGKPMTVAFQAPGAFGAAPTDEIEVRYERMTRVAHDSTKVGDTTVCIFREEFKNGTRVSDIDHEEIAEGIEVPSSTTAANNLVITPRSDTQFVVSFAFTPQFSVSTTTRTANVPATALSSFIVLRNTRRDH